MDTFNFYLQEGLWHITDLSGYDHIIFVAALSLSYRMSYWKELIFLITAFTIGHSIALAAAVFELLHFSPELVEFLIPLSIALTALHNLLRGEVRRVVPMLYVLALGFGLIHGLGFSNYLNALLGQEESLAVPLFAFNVGLELGQIAILIPVLVLGNLWAKFAPHRWWIALGSSIILALSLNLCVEKGSELFAGETEKTGELLEQE